MSVAEVSDEVVAVHPDKTMSRGLKHRKDNWASPNMHQRNKLGMIRNKV